MIASRGLKRRLAGVAVILGAALALGAILLATQVVSLSSTNVDPATAFHQVAELPPEADHMVSWAADAWDQERVMEPATRIAIEAAYVRAWAALGVYQSTGSAAALTTLFSGPARAAALAVPRGTPAATWSVAHRLQLEFYALDGATVGITDTDARLVRTIGTGTAESVSDSAENYSVVMVLEDGYWRIRQLRRGAGSTGAVVTTTPTGQTQVIGVPTLHSPNTVAALRATDYTPVGWPGTPSEVITADLIQVRDLGLDAVRLRIPFDQLTSPGSLARLPELLGTAHAAGLAVIVVLFDGDDVSPAGWAAADYQLAQLMPAISGNPAVALVDIADQPDLRTGTATGTEIRAFLLHEALLLQSLSPTTPVTISWATPAAAADPAMIDLVDMVSMHWTGTSADLAAAIEPVRAAAGIRPMMIIASTTPSDGGWSPNPHSERRQAVEVAGILQAADRAGVASISVDQLADSGTDRHGMVRADGSRKPAALQLAPTTTNPMMAGSAVADYAGSKFWRAGAFLLILAVLVVFRRQIRRGWSLLVRRVRPRGR